MTGSLARSTVRPGRRVGSQISSRLALLILMLVTFGSALGTRQQAFGENRTVQSRSAFRSMGTNHCSQEPWFQGWYTRITDAGGATSIAVIGATQFLPGRSAPFDTDLPGYLAVIVNDTTTTRVYEAFPERTSFWSNRDQVLDDPQSPDWEEFVWYAEGYGTITNHQIDVRIPDAVEAFAILGEREPWNSRVPWLGPEGLVEFLPFVPLHWLVYSLGSDAAYSYTVFDTEREPARCGGFGLAHQESNWGRVFPPAWVWAEGISVDTDAQFALSGGDLMLGDSILTTWFVAYHSRRIQWEFRQATGTVFVTDIDAVNGRFQLMARDARRELVIDAIAAPDSFVELSVPSEAGFLPGAVESFSAVVRATAFRRLPGGGTIPVAASRFEHAALEFGGDFISRPEVE